MRTAASAFIVGVWLTFLFIDVLYCCGGTLHPNGANIFLDVFGLSLMAFIAHHSIKDEK